MPDSLQRLTPDILLNAYRSGVFPMSESRDDPDIFWVEPRMRGIIPLDQFHISKSLAKAMRQGGYSVTWDNQFAQVVRQCANRDETWINETIFDLSCALFAQGDGHSVEVWSDGYLVGGVYGFTIGAAFFGESMFSTKTNASKIALAFLVDQLNQGGFELFDTQFITPHLARMGAIEISKTDYQKRLFRATNSQARFCTQTVPTAQDVIQRNAQIS